MKIFPQAFLTLCLMMQATISPAQSEPVDVKSTATDSETTDFEADYQQQINHIKNNEVGADFTELRMAYTKTSAYSPYGAMERNFEVLMFQALNQGEHAQCVARANDLLARNYTSLRGHYGAMVCHYELEHQEQGQYHQFVIRGLIDSIRQSGDGKSTESAFITISTGEVHSFLQLVGYDVKGQAVSSSEGKAYDRMEVVHMESGEEKVYYFDISLQMAHGFDDLFDETQ